MDIKAETITIMVREKRKDERKSKNSPRTECKDFQPNTQLSKSRCTTTVKGDRKQEDRK